MSETLKDLLEYLQNKIDSGEHKIFYNDLGWDIKTIDCINAINEQQEEIERLNNIKKKAINELFNLKDMIYKPETREINFDIQNKISSIIKILGSDKE